MDDQVPGLVDIDCEEDRETWQQWLGSSVADDLFGKNGGNEEGVNPNKRENQGDGDADPEKKRKKKTAGDEEPVHVDIRFESSKKRTKIFVLELDLFMLFHVSIGRS